MKADDEKKLAERKRHAKVARDALGENLRAIRKKKKWAQAKLAEITGLSVNEIGGLERKKIVPSLGVLMALSNGLGISISRLITPGIWSRHGMENQWLPKRKSCWRSSSSWMKESAVIWSE